MTDVNAVGVYNLMVCVPLPFLITVFRLGVRPPSARNIGEALRAVLPASILEARPTDLIERGGAVPSARLDSLLARLVWALVNDNASVMATMRLEAESSGLMDAVYGCLPQVTNFTALPRSL